MDEPGSNMIEFRALGSAELKGPEGNDLLSVLARPKLLALLSYLAASAGRAFVRRDTLINLFWGEVDLDRARNSLRQSLHHLRRSLGEDVLVGRGDDEVGLAEGAFWCDVAAFESALTDARREEALELYRGGLLEGFFVADAPEYERWLDGRRAELRGKAAAAAWELAEAAESARDTTGARGWARRALELSPLEEDLVQRVISLLDRAGDRSHAVQQYEAFTRRLKTELDLEPAPETKALIGAVRGRTL
ncbi:MAG: winged helix-turn-helix domain-containing protein, partial [Gemmatimonadota bacterium]